MENWIDFDFAFQFVNFQHKYQLFDALQSGRTYDDLIGQSV